jgi:hypothetical protein
MAPSIELMLGGLVFGCLIILYFRYVKGWKFSWEVARELREEAMRQAVAQGPKNGDICPRCGKVINSAHWWD